MSWTPPSFDVSKANFLRIARAVEKAQSKAELRALLLADVGGAHHSFNTLELIDRSVNVAVTLLESMGDDLDEQGAPA